MSSSVATPVTAGQAVAWNPSLPGGAKAEDTYLVSPAGLERITAVPDGTGPGGQDRRATGRDGPGPHSAGPHSAGPQTTRPGWPAEDDELVPPRPAVLEVA